MTGNQSRYSVENKRPYQKLLELYDVPNWFSLEPYKNARKWTATRWLLEIDRRREIYLIYNKQKRSELCVDRKIDVIKDAIETFFGELSKEYSNQKINSQCLIHNAVLGYTIVTPKDALVETLDCKIESRPVPGVKDLDLLFLVCPVGSSLGGHVAPSEGHNALTHSVVSVDLNAPNKDIKDAFSNWLEKERERKNIKEPVIFGGKERTSNKGRKPKAGEVQLHNLADDYYLAYWELRLLIQLKNRPLPSFRDWLDLLGLSGRVKKPSEAKYLGEAEWLLSDKARGLLKAAAEEEARGFLKAAEEEEEDALRPGEG